ncbi:hypothetical protein [Flavobacterium sp. MK4S-17]|jgi:hypothetical protein|uniref:hypothetical protein n=1 Tax=Flavobacterium sp. MK4S-17 TaxID=2543737 RepID=UPI0013574EFA|nr:hypothetical protein [Flavobacterium sp. MK4S-17]
MTNNVLKFYFLAFLLVSDFVVFAQDTGPTEDTGGPEDSDPAAPINTKLIVLALAGIMFAYYYFIKKRKEQLN